MRIMPREQTVKNKSAAALGGEPQEHIHTSGLDRNSGLRFGDFGFQERV
jgi:hypothetical protein